MNSRLARIESLVLSLTTLMAIAALCSSAMRPLGIVFGGCAAWLDFVVIRHLASLAFSHRPSAAHVLPLALAKSFALIAVPAMALFLPSSLVDGVSFAVGVTALPTAVVLDALSPVVEESGQGDT